MNVKRILYYALPAISIVLLVAVFAVFVGRQDSACAQVEGLRTVVRTILTNGETATLKSPVITANERVVAIKFYTDALTLLSPHHC